MAPLRRRAAVRLWILLALALLALPDTHAQVEARPASFLVFHAPGGEDPLASPLAPPPAGVDRLPTTILDGVERADPAPENAPENALAHFREIQRLLQRREAEPAGANVTLRGELRPGVLAAHAEVSRGPLELTFVLFEHGVPVDGRQHPYVARFRTEPVAIPAEGATRASEIRLDPAWGPERIGVAAILRDGDRVVQSATWTPRLDAPTEQTARAVLVEHVTATWCDHCRGADEAIALLATQRGVAGPLEPGDVSYGRMPTPLFYAGAALGLVAAAWLLRRSPA